MLVASDVSHPLMSWLKAAAFRNMLLKAVVTALAVFHRLSGWLNAEAPKNILAKLVAFDTSQLSMFWLNAAQFMNMEFMLVRPAVIQLDMCGSFKAVHPARLRRVKIRADGRWYVSEYGTDELHHGQAWIGTEGEDLDDVT